MAFVVCGAAAVFALLAPELAVVMLGSLCGACVATALQAGLWFRRQLGGLGFVGD